jgi:hypothetical protein
MLTKLFTNKIECTLDAYWKYALTEDYNHCLYVDFLRYPKYRLLHEEDTGDRVHRRIEYVPPPPPGAVRRLAGSLRASLLTEEIVFDKRTRCAEIRYLPQESGSVSRRVNIHAAISCTPSGQSGIDRVCECNMALDFPLIGGMAERALARFLEEQAVTHARFAGAYIRDRESSASHEYSLM